VPKELSTSEALLTLIAGCLGGFSQIVGGTVELKGKTGSSVSFNHTDRTGLVKKYVIKIKEK
jgi:hypothetical protein